MQIKRSLQKKLYQKRWIDETEYSNKAYERFRILESFKKLRSEGCSEKTALESLETSRAMRNELYPIICLASTGSKAQWNH
jgi:hypothetical protein